MENSYGVGVVNRYALFLDDESDPLEAIKAREQQKELKKKTKDAEKENKGKPESKPKAVAPVRKGIKETQNVKSQEVKSGEQQKSKGPARPNDRERNPERNPERNSERPPPRRREDRPPNGAVEGKDGAPRPPRREFTDRRPNYERRNQTENEGGERRGPRPPREPRDRDGPRAPRPYDNRGKREFDRRSGSDKTGVKPVEKRDGAGPHNWGTIKDDMEADEHNKTGSEGEVAEEKVAEGAAAGAGGDGQPEGERAAPAEEEPRELTLDEYKALRNAQRTAPQYNLRKPGEGEDLSQWKNLVELEKKKEEAAAEEEESDEEYDIADYPQRVGRQKRVLGIEFTFSDTARRGGAGAGRGRGRGGRGGGGGPGAGGPGGPRPRGPPREEAAPEERPPPRAQVAPPKVDDSKDFPSLG